MKPAPVGYAAPGTVADALELLDTYGDDAKLLAGGQSLVPLLNMRLVRPTLLVDLNRVPELTGIERQDGWSVVGATTRQRAVELDSSIGEALPIVPAALGHVGHVQIRNRGTVGGSMAHADPSAELPLLSVLLDAELSLASVRGGQRTVAAKDFYVNYLTTAMQANELLVKIRIPVPEPGTAWAFAEVARRDGDFALVAVGVLLKLDADGRIEQPRIAVGGAHPVPLRLEAAERALHGRRPSPSDLDEVAALGVQTLEPDADVHASAEYRRRVAACLVKDLVGQALERAERQA